MWRKITHKKSERCTEKQNLIFLQTVTSQVPPLKSRLPEEDDLIDLLRVPKGNNLDSLDESKESCNIICEVQNQANEATSAQDMSVDAVILCDDPKCALVDSKIQKKLHKKLYIFCTQLLLFLF